MKAILITSITLLSFLFNHNSEAKDIWMTPPRSPQEFSKFLDPKNISEWQNSFNSTSTFKFYIGDAGLEQVKSFSTYAKSKGKKIAFELGAVYAAACDDGPYSADGMPMMAQRGIEYEGSLLKKFKDSKIEIDYLVLDGPFIRIFDPGMGSNCVKKFGSKMTPEYVALQVATYMKALRVIFPQVKFILLSNFPNWNFSGTPSINGVGNKLVNSLGQALSYEDVFTVGVTTAEKQGIPFWGFQIDNPYNFQIYANGTSLSGYISEAEQEQRWSRLKNLIQLANSSHLTTSLIINSEVNESSPQASRDFSELALKYAEETQTRGLNVSTFMIQSWYSVPQFILPETQDYSFTNLIREADKVLNSSAPVPAPVPTPAPVDPNIFNEACYLQRYPDVAQNWKEPAINHWNKFGKNEGRIPGCTGPLPVPAPVPTPAPVDPNVFNEACYLQRYPDVAQNWKEPAINHWNKFGKNEGRIPGCTGATPAPTPTKPDPSVFNEACYLRRYPDVAQHWTGPAIDHWNKFGKNEGRIPGCN